MTITSLAESTGSFLGLHKFFTPYDLDEPLDIVGSLATPIARPICCFILAASCASISAFSAAVAAAGLLFTVGTVALSPILLPASAVFSPNGARSYLNLILTETIVTGAAACIGIIAAAGALLCAAITLISPFTATLTIASRATATLIASCEESDDRVTPALAR